jgi:transcriptional regulator with XRE-family HTH domain
MAKQQLPSQMKSLAGLRLRAARLALGVQAEKDMAKQLGVGSNAYSNYERGLRLVDVSMAVRLLELTGIGPDWIYAGSTNGVPFDRAQSLRAHLQKLQQKTTAPPPFQVRGGHNNNLDRVSADCAAKVPAMRVVGDAARQ